MNSQTVPISLDSWPRADHFRHYMKHPCSYNLTVNVDTTQGVAQARGNGYSVYLAHVWAVAEVFNNHDEFRLGMHADELVQWPVTHPAFTVFHREPETFSSLWVPFDRTFAKFHAVAQETIAEYDGCPQLFPQADRPENSFDISGVPWVSFSAFSLNLPLGLSRLAPILTLGRFEVRDGRTLLPVSVQIHHAAADGFHIARFVRELEELLTEPSWLY